MYVCHSVIVCVFVITRSYAGGAITVPLLSLRPVYLLRRHASVVQSVLLLVPDTHALATHPTVGGRLVQFDCDLLAV